jgi:hypothetical protein
MAIGDTLNQNPFGTNYNAEEEERKKAELAAQGAMMGAGNVPASAPNPVTFLPYADDVSTPRASALSVFTPSGDLKPGIDVNAITPSPTTLPDPNAVNTALNQEVPVDPVNNEPGFLYNTFVNAPVQADQRATEFMSNLGEKISAGYDNLLGSAMRNLTPVEELGYTPEPFGKTFTDTFAITRPDGTKFYPDEVTTPGGTTQAPSGASALGATQGVTTTVETPTAGAQGQKAALDPTSDESILARRAQREAQFSPQGLMGQDATRAALGGMTLNEYLNAPAGTPGVSGLRTDPQGRMITPTPPLRVEPEVVQPPVDRDIIPAVAQPPVDSVVPTEVAQPPVDALSSFEQDSLSRQQRIGGTGSFEGDSEAREARLRENERRPGESQADRDTRVAQSKTTSGQTGGLSFDDARRRAEGQLAARGVKNPSASQVNALARSIQAAEPERLAELETKRALDAIKLRDAEAKKDFKPQIVEIGDQRLIQLAPEYYQPIRPEPKEGEPFEPRILEHNGFIYFERKLNEFERQPSTKAGGATSDFQSFIDQNIAAGGEVATTPVPNSTSSAAVRINSQAEYDALAVGTPYIDSQGTETVKK